MGTGAPGWIQVDVTFTLRRYPMDGRLSVDRCQKVAPPNVRRLFPFFMARTERSPSRRRGEVQGSPAE